MFWIFIQTGPKNTRKKNSSNGLAIVYYYIGHMHVFRNFDRISFSNSSFDFMPSNCVFCDFIRLLKIYLITFFHNARLFRIVEFILCQSILKEKIRNARLLEEYNVIFVN